MQQHHARAGNVTYLDAGRGHPKARVIRLTRAAIDRHLNGDRAGPEEVAAGVIRIDESGLRAAIGRRIRLLRHRRAMSQNDLAEIVDCDRSAVCRWETGERAPSLAHLIAVCRVLDCSPDSLLNGEG